MLMFIKFFDHMEFLSEGIGRFQSVFHCLHAFYFIVSYTGNLNITE